MFFNTIPITNYELSSDIPDEDEQLLPDVIVYVLNAKKKLNRFFEHQT